MVTFIVEMSESSQWIAEWLTARSEPGTLCLNLSSATGESHVSSLCLAARVCEVGPVTGTAAHCVIVLVQCQLLF